MMTREEILGHIYENSICPLLDYCDMTADEAIDWLSEPDWNDSRIPGDIRFIHEDVYFGVGYITGVAAALDESIEFLAREALLG